MNRPRDIDVINLCDVTVKVIRVDGDSVCEDDDDGTRTVAMYCDHDETMHIANGMDDDRFNEKFLHELIHAVSTNRWLCLTEKKVASLSHGLYQVLRDHQLYFGFDSTQKKASAEK